MNQTALPQSEAAPGHNLPPEVESTFDQLSARTSALVENANRWANERPIIETETDSIKGGDFLDQLRTQIKENAFNKKFIDHLRTLFNVYVKGDPTRTKLYFKYTQNVNVK
ncbi:hypothetical protein LCGC14_2960140 [marine sediment metagenome]|uniref:Uncharacterized protein n=1 Tax=marine sediment metagenome TaxID=412755 RepID=A0A0F8XCC1_9ZZZZ